MNVFIALKGTHFLFLFGDSFKAVVVCIIDRSSSGINHFPYFTHQHSEKRIDIQCQVTFGFKYNTLSIC